MNYKKPIHELILKEYIKEILYEEKDNTARLEENKWLGRGIAAALLFGVPCVARNTKWEELAGDLVVLGGAEYYLVKGLHKGKPVVVLTAALFAFVWNKYPNAIRNTPYLATVADALNLLPQHESRNWGWALAGLVVPIGAEVGVARRRGIAAMRPDADGTLTVGDPVDPNFTGIRDVAWNNGKLNYLLAKFGILNTFIRDRKFAEALGFVNSTEFRQALIDGADNVDEILKAGGAGGRALDADSTIKSFNEGITKMLKTNLNDRELSQWGIWAWVQKPLRAARSRAQGMRHHMNALMDVTNKQWKSLSTHTKNKAKINLKADGMGSGFQGVVDQELVVFSTFEDQLILKFEPQGASTASTVQLADAPGWIPGQKLTLKQVPQIRPGLHIPDTNAEVLGEVPFLLSWADSGGVPAMMYNMPNPDKAGEMMEILIVSKRDVFDTPMFMLPGDAKIGEKMFAPSSLGAYAVVAAQLYKAYPMESGPAEPTAGDMIAYDEIEALLKAGAAAAGSGEGKATSGGCAAVEYSGKAMAIIKHAWNAAWQRAGYEEDDAEDVDTEINPEDAGAEIKPEPADTNADDDGGRYSIDWK